MHPRMMGHWSHPHSAHCCSSAGGFCTPGGEHGWERHYHGGEYGGPGFGGGSFGVRRPLRFLAWKLQLDEGQVTGFATILNELKTERAQAAVDDRRTLTAFADAVAGETFDEARAGEAAAQRVKSAERLQATVAKALGRIHALLAPEQRARLAYLIRTGALVL
ncbi:MAG TPA: Spy/CpxP family protein refolding chaperone [Candidatus Eisenbacteria bacterium]